jgi:hypothetical protein
MTHKYLKFILLFSLIASTSMADASEWFTGNIKSVYPLANGSFIITFTSDVGSKCYATGTPKYYRIEENKNDLTADAVRNFLATVLTAQATGRKLSVYHDTSENCYVNRLLIE